MSEVSSESSIIFGVGSPIPKPRMKGNGIFGHVPDAFDGKSLDLEKVKKLSNGVKEKEQDNAKDDDEENHKNGNNHQNNGIKSPNHLMNKKETLQTRLAKKKQVSAKITFIDEEVKIIFSIYIHNLQNFVFSYY